MLLIVSFLALIAVGTLLLKLPFAARGGVSVDWVDALFTATSASCVTGLTTVPVSGFSWFGQCVILCLIQLGGLGFMSLSAFIILLLGRTFSFSNTLILSSLNDDFSMRRVEDLMRNIIIYTATVEFTGFMLLSPAFYLAGYGADESAYLGLFHAVSAFCNAGLSPFDESLIGQTAYVKLVMAGLIVLGGLGIYVIYDVVRYRSERRLAAHTKVVLVATAALLVGGCLAIKGCQLRHPVEWLDAFFMSVTARTAGFNSVSMSVLSPGTVAVLIVLMLIGAAPGSTGGGIKVPAVALAVMAVYNTIKGNSKLVLFHREIPVANIFKAFTMINIYVVLTVIGTIVLAAISGIGTDKTLFETASALGTVGLSLGFSAESDTAARLLLAAYMFIGRVGPFTIFLFLLGQEKQTLLKYPEERILIG